MARIILITGGGRSGKSGYALKLAHALPGPRAFIATCPALDDEMRERVRTHKEARADYNWLTVEETLNLCDALRRAAHCAVFVVDCLTLWVNNLMYQAQSGGMKISEDRIAGRCNDVIEASREIDGTVIFVTNEVGMGIVPCNDVSRRFRDLAGRCNQVFAAAADEVTLVVCGLPLHLKKRAES